MDADHYTARAAREALLESASLRLGRPWCCRSRDERHAIASRETEGLELAHATIDLARAVEAAS